MPAGAVPGAGEPPLRRARRVPVHRRRRPQPPPAPAPPSPAPGGSPRRRSRPSASVTAMHQACRRSAPAARPGTTRRGVPAAPGPVPAVTGSPSTSTGSRPGPGAPAAADSSVSSAATTSTCAVTAGWSCPGGVTRRAAPRRATARSAARRRRPSAARACASSRAPGSRPPRVRASSPAARPSRPPGRAPYVGVPLGLLPPPVGRGRVRPDQLRADQRPQPGDRQSRSPAATPPPRPRPARRPGTPGAGQPSSAAIARARGQSSPPSASAAQVAGSRRRNVVDVLPQLRRRRPGAVQDQRQLVGEELRHVLVQHLRRPLPRRRPRPARAAGHRSPAGPRPAPRSAPPCTRPAPPPPLPPAATAPPSAPRVINATGSRSPSRDGREDTTPAGTRSSPPRGLAQLGDGHTDTERLRREHA